MQNRASANRKRILCCALAIILIGILGAVAKRHLTPPKADLSYYSLTAGTIHLSKGYVPPSITLVGQALPHPVFVVSDVGKNYVAITQNGKVIAQEKGLRLGKNIGVDDHHLYVPSDGALLVLDKTSFEEVERYALPYEASFVSMHDSKFMMSPFTAGSHVSIYRFNDDQSVTEEYTAPVSSDFARGADIQGNIMLISDTLGHKIIAYDMKAKRVIATKPAYYPNSVHFVAQDTALITEEHTNRITKWNIRTNDYRVVFGCPLQFHHNKTFDAKSAGALQASLFAYTANDDAPNKSLCAENFAGIDTLYSPNGARQYGDGYLIADTDNHRVVWVKEGKVVSALYGFNNPVDAVFVE